MRLAKLRKLQINERPPRTGLGPVLAPRQGAVLNPYTNETLLKRFSQGWSGESNPCRDVHSVACCHYTMTTVKLLHDASGSDCARIAQEKTSTEKLQQKTPKSGAGL